MMISTQKTQTSLYLGTLQTLKRGMLHVSCLLHVPSFTWYCSPVCLLIMIIQKPYKRSPLDASYPIETFLPPVSLCPPLYHHFLPVAHQNLLGFWNSLRELLLESNSPHDLFFYFSLQEGTGGDWGNYSHGILISPHAWGLLIFLLLDFPLHFTWVLRYKNQWIFVGWRTPLKTSRWSLRIPCLSR